MSLSEDTLAAIHLFVTSAFQVSLATTHISVSLLIHYLTLDKESRTTMLGTVLFTMIRDSDLAAEFIGAVG